MRSNHSSEEHAAAVSRRLATLSAELAAVRGEDRAGPPELGPGSGDRAADAPAPELLPAPGGHGRRRARSRYDALTRLQARLPVGLGPGHVALVAVLAAAAVAVAAWLVLGSRAQPAPLPVPAGASPDSTATVGGSSVEPLAATASKAPAARSKVTVDVAGKVRDPGIVVLPPGSRVVDALEAAGGARRRADLTSLNQARVLVDGEQVLVGVPAPGPVGAAAAAGPPADGPLVNLNTADAATLETLSGVGPVTAQAILDWRAEHGAFTAVEELLEVDGIGEATLAELAPHVTI